MNGLISKESLQSFSWGALNRASVRCRRTCFAAGRPCFGSRRRDVIDDCCGSHRPDRRVVRGKNVSAFGHQIAHGRREIVRCALARKWFHRCLAVLLKSPRATRGKGGARDGSQPARAKTTSLLSGTHACCAPQSVGVRAVAHQVRAHERKLAPQEATPSAIPQSQFRRPTLLRAVHGSNFRPSSKPPAPGVA